MRTGRHRVIRHIEVAEAKQAETECKLALALAKAHDEQCVSVGLIRGERATSNTMLSKISSVRSAWSGW